MLFTEMSQQIQLKTDTKRYKTRMQIYQRRLKAAPAATIAKELGVSRQDISAILKGLPKSDTVLLRPPANSMKKAMEICGYYAQGMTLEEICEKAECQEDQVLSVFAYIGQKHSCVTMSDAFPRVSKWMRYHGLSFNQLSEIIDVNSGPLRAMILGQQYMPLYVAKKIREVSGLSIAAIYGMTEADLPASLVHDFSQETDIVRE